MIFSGSITIDHGKTRVDPNVERLKITQGVITQIDIMFPPGCAHTAFISFNRALHQIYPSNPDGFFMGDGVNISGGVFHYVKADPFELQIHGWAPDANYDHTIFFLVWIKKLWQLNPLSDEFWHLTVEDSLKEIL